MDQPPASRRSGKTPRKSELYSTVVIHDSGSESESEARPARSPVNDVGIFSTMVYKGGVGGGGRGDFKDGNTAEDDEDEDSLPPLLKHLPKDFGGDVEEEEEEEDNYGDFGTMIVKTGRSHHPNQSVSSYSPSSASLTKPRGSSLAGLSRRTGYGDDNDGGEEGEGFGTFVVKSTVSGRAVGRTGSGGGSGSTMGRVVASMQAVGDLGLGKKTKESGPLASRVEEARHQQLQSKISSSSIPESVTREDPATKYELLNELGACTF